MAKKQSFNEKLERLEEIMEILDESDKPLEELIKLYEEGIKLTKTLREFIDKAEQKVIDISSGD